MRNREQVGGSYHDRIPLEHDFETVQARTASLTSRGAAVDLDISALPSPWTVGSSWAPEESYEFSLDPDDGWYDEAIKANIEDVMEEFATPKLKKRRTHVSVRLQSVLLTVICHSDLILLAGSASRFLETDRARKVSRRIDTIRRSRRFLWDQSMSGLCSTRK